MAHVKYYPEDVLVEKVQSGEYGWLDYINHHSPEWQEEYTAFCKEKDLIVNEESAEEFVDWKGEQMALLILGVGLLLFVPVFKTITHLPPYMGMLLGLGVMWMVTELMHKKKSNEIKKRLSVVNILKNVETPTIFFFLGILTAVGALGAAGQLSW